MSNKFSKARGLLVRPKVCKSKPPVEAPGVETVCTIDPRVFEVQESDEENLTAHAFNSSFDEDADVVISFLEPRGVLEFETPFKNNAESLGLYQADIGEYSEEIVVTFTWPDDSTCQVTLIITVVPF